MIVVTGPSERWAETMTLSERVNPADFESEHFASQLIERLLWAVGDAHEAERAKRVDGTHERSVPKGNTADRARGGGGSGERR